MMRAGLAFVLAGAIACASGPPEPVLWIGPQAAQYLQADADRRAAQVAADPVALDRVLHPALVYRHSDGRAESKAEFIASLTGGSVDYQEIQIERAAVYRCEHLSPGAGICVIAAQTLIVEHEGTVHRVPGCATAQYRSTGERLALVAYESRLRRAEANPRDCLP